MIPMTHHEILRIVAPFTRRDWRLDPATSDRQKRRLVFRPSPPATAPKDEPAGAVGDGSARRISLVLEYRNAETWRLVRVIDDPSGVTVRLETEGDDLEVMLACLDSVAPERQFRKRQGYLLGTSWRVDAKSVSPREPVLTDAVVRLADVVMTVRISTLRGYPADVELVAADSGRLDLTEDLLAVLGTAWSTLRYDGSKWIGTLRLRWREPTRSRAAEDALTAAAEHLARTLAEPPRCFHARLYRARWGVVLRRAVPLIVCILLLIGTLALTKVDIDQSSGLWVALFHAPPLLLVAFFCMREIPRIEIPPLPRVSPTATWRPVPGGDGPAAADSSAG